MTQIIVSGAVLAFIIGVLYVIYLKGKSDEREHQLARSVDDLLASKEKREKLEAAHEKRVKDITDGPISADDAAILLSRFPENETTPKT